VDGTSTRWISGHRRAAAVVNTIDLEQPKDELSEASLRPDPDALGG
jgi:hypothetical protein